MLSRLPVSNESLIHIATAQDGKVVSQVFTVTPCMSLCSRQEDDPNLIVIRDYLLNNELPTDEKRAREMVLQKSEFEMIDRVQYYVEKDKTLRIVHHHRREESFLNWPMEEYLEDTLGVLNYIGQLAKQYIGG